MIRALEALGAAALLVAAAPAPAQDVAGLTWLQGSWRGTGTAFGRPSEARLEVRPALGGRFLELSYRAGTFEGRAFYRPAGEGRWQATWFDSHGASFPIDAVAAERLLTANWGAAGAQRGLTTYRLLPDGRLELVDHAGGRVFATHVLSRAD